MLWSVTSSEIVLDNEENRKSNLQFQCEVAQTPMLTSSRYATSGVYIYTLSISISGVYIYILYIPPTDRGIISAAAN